MKTTILAPHGGPVECCTHKGRIIAAWQSGADTNARQTVPMEPIE